MIFFYLIFIFSFQPILILFSIIGQCSLFIYYLMNIMNNIWFSVVIILVYIGGVMIIFLYVNSVSSKVMNKSFFSIFFFFFLFFFIGFTSFNYFDYLFLFKLFFSLKEFYFFFFVFYLLIFIYLINNLLLLNKSPLNSNM